MLSFLPDIVNYSVFCISSLTYKNHTSWLAVEIEWENCELINNFMVYIYIDQKYTFNFKNNHDSWTLIKKRQDVAVMQ